METYSRNEEGLFVVQLPIRSSINILHSLFRRAKRASIKSGKTSMSREIQLADKDFISEYEYLGYITKLTNLAEADIQSSYYIPHHILKKPSSTIIKYRIVFNAFAVDNHFMMEPTPQLELSDAIICFR